DATSGYCGVETLDLVAASDFATFFFHCTVPHRNLPSFPTRRSSDLQPSIAEIATRAASRRRPSGRRCPPAAPRGPPPRRRRRARSEEHTSELQSQSNLVCRLLLEKKKKKPNGRLQRN